MREKKLNKNSSLNLKSFLILGMCLCLPFSSVRVFELV